MVNITHTMNTKSINIAVAEQVEKLGSEKVISNVVEKLVSLEVNKRADALSAAVKLAEDTIREQKKAKPDQLAISADGTRIESFSAKAFEAQKKLDEKLARIENIVSNATEKGEWGKLYELVKGGSQPVPNLAADDDSANT